MIRPWCDGTDVIARADARYQPGDWASLVLTVTSTRIGHAFPTYVTPRVIMQPDNCSITPTGPFRGPASELIARGFPQYWRKSTRACCLWFGATFGLSTPA